ncbi:axin-1 isoform X1 [Lingula anatina]|uniref:Axin-1 isoform X1 n=2 Tax=Lingula anatina TaxID=7574 RepID=A0A1S3IX94_LINAN|nr:axin-1 isoform X1 [Lingula anatina]|eukprot:XP_013402825.1 axin-1 isoform X1 [Lingula anatina]
MTERETASINNMSIEVHQFVNDSGGHKFTETAPRPPVPGEENELQSNGGHSTRSSGSHKSHASHKSHSSSKSLKSDVSHSPAGTPRRSNLDKGGGSLTNSNKDLNAEEIEAPLGFEPEGSAANSPPFTETPPYLNWAKNFNLLLGDADGVKLFREFLEQEQTVNLLDFWFAVNGLKKQEKAQETQIIKLIYKKYIRGDTGIQLSGEIRKEIQDKIANKKDIDGAIFDSAQAEVEDIMRNETYQTFLKSDLYVQYLQNGGESPKGGSSNSSGSNSARPLSVAGPLPTLHEDSELLAESIPQTTVPIPLTTKSLTATRNTRLDSGFPPFKRPEAVAGLYLQPGGRVPHPYHVSYAPVSAQDSELQSLSSDALTDDTMSLTDSSVDGIPPNRRYWRRHRKQMQRSAAQNRDTALSTHLIPRTERIKDFKERNIAETDPHRFASMLIEKLKKVERERDMQEEFNKKMTLISEGEESEIELVPKTAMASNPVFTMLMAQATQEQSDLDNSQSILDEHCSRIWDSSTGQTPSRSPGKQTPSRSKSPERAHRRSSGIGAATSLPGTMNRPKTKKDRGDHMSMVSCDSGVSSQEHQAVYYDQDTKTRHVHHYHHYYHNMHSGKPRQHLEHHAEQRSMAHFHGDQTARSVGDNSGMDLSRGRTRDSGSKRSGSKKSIDASSADLQCDSGVSGVDQPPVPDLTNPANEKVMNWILENEKIRQSASTNTDSERSTERSSSKRSHHSKPSSSNAQQPHRQSAGSKSKPPVQYNVSRSGSLDRSGISSVINAQLAPMHVGRPSQPFAQDPSMPLLPPPNATTQLEEARRRLENEAHARQLAKELAKGSRTCNTGMPVGRQKYPASSSVPPTHPLASMQQQVASGADRPSSAPAPGPATSVPVVAASGTSSQEVTVVGYYFCSEPIPYRTQLPGKSVTLAQFKSLLTKKGNYRYFFKCASDEFETGVVHVEVINDNAILPLYEGKVVAKVEKVE